MPKLHCDMENLVTEKCKLTLQNLKKGDLITYKSRREPVQEYKWLILEDRIYGSPFVNAFNIQNGSHEVINIAWRFLQRAKVIPGSERKPDPQSET